MLTWGGAGRNRRQLTALAIIAVSAVVANLAIPLLIAQGRPAELVNVVALTIMSLTSGLILVATGWRDPESRLQFYLGLAVLVAMFGRIVGYLLVSVWGYSTTAANPGQFIQATAAVFVAAGFWSFLRVTFAPAAAARYITELVLLASLLGLFWWRLMLLVTDGWLPPSSRVIFNLMVFTMFAMFVIFLGPRATLPSRIAGIGGVGIVTFDAVRLLLLAAGLPAVMATFLLVNSWALCTAGLVRVSIQPPELSERAAARDESRRNVYVLTVAWAFLAGAVLLTVANPVLDLWTGVLFLVGLTALWVRELVQAGQLNRTLDAMRVLAHRDPLTGLGNRRALEDEFRLHRRHEGVVTVTMIDLDGFKGVNDQLGHRAGDQFLGRVAKLVQAKALECRGEAYRIGGDEFVVLTRDAPEVAERSARQLVRDIELAGMTGTAKNLVDVGASAGVAHRRLTGVTSMAEMLGVLGSASTAMRKVKRDGGHGLVVFDEGLAAVEQRRLEVARRLTEAVADGAVDVRFQPLMSVETGLIAGVEALARWTDPVLGVVPPGEFVPLAEETGLIRDLGAQVLRKSLVGALASGLVRADLSVSVNVSTIQLRVPGFAESVMRLLDELGVRPRLLTVEVTETVFVRAGDPAVRTLFDLADLGVQIALDDFGTGYCSIGYLTRLPVTCLKIDRSLTTRLDEPPVLAIARSVTEMASALNLLVVVEGVETSTQLSGARDLGAQLIQGYYFSRDVDTERLAGMISDRAPSSPA